MTPQELRDSILQLAIQGKLVEQRPEEGTAEELYREIQREKARLIQEGKIKREKPMPEIAEEEKPFEIPEGWKWVRLGSLILLLSGRDLEPSKYNNLGEGIPYITGASNICDSHVVINRWTLYAQAIAKKGELLLTCKGTVGKMAVLQEDSAHIARQIMALTPIIVNISYLKYFIESQIKQLKVQAKSMIPGIERNNVITLPCALPPLAEQKRIVAKIEALLPYVDRYEQAWNRLEAFNKRFPDDMKKSILQLAIQGKLVEQRPEEGTAEELYQEIQREKARLIETGKLKRTKTLPEIAESDIPAEFPEGWKVCYMDDIAFITKLAGFEYTESIAPNLTMTGIPLFKGKNVQNGKLILEFESFIPEVISDSLPRSQIRKKCLLTPYVGTIGNIAIFDGGFKAHLGSNVGKIELLQDTQQYILEEYVLYYLRSKIGYQELTKYKKATAQESISIDAIRNVIIAIPPLAEQKRIVAKLDELLSMCERLV